MKESTRLLKAEAEKDISRIYSHNNSKLEKRTPEQNEQSRNARVSHFEKKWTRLLESCETVAQKKCCLDVLSRLQYIR